ncbi:hypothetical protein [Paenibacillus soyae]|uniref:Nucleotidyltransferase family protein n=1 Tax=Paenibacillus soyae TaxID=2969249 RepID=A0A9X2MMD7_9BACL|nr:hypothetical protein [Paenibacillus soyae]MCR2803025.1 hypothetical protein [Paenibacillus soyae]
MTESTNIGQALGIVSAAAGTSGWALGGSAGLLLRGVRLEAPPRDIDLYCDEHRMGDIHLALAPYATDSPSYSETPIYRSTLSHYDIKGCKVELVGGFEVRNFGCRYSVDVDGFLVPFGDLVHLELENSRSAEVRVVPLAHELLFNVLRGREDRVRLIADAMRRGTQTHVAAFAMLQAGNEITREVGEQLRLILGGEREWTRR